MAALTVPTIFTAVDKMSSVLSKMQGNVGKFATETEKKYAAMSRRMQNIQSNASQIGIAAGIAGAAIMVPLGASVKKAVEFEDQMANVATLVDTTKENMTQMGNEVLNSFVKLPVPLHDLTEALYKVRSAGIPAAQAMDVLNKSAVLGITGRGTATQGADAITSAINVFKDEGLSTNKIASMLFQTVAMGKTTLDGMAESFGATANIVHNGGVKLEDFLSAIAAMTVQGEPAAQAMNQIRSSVLALEKPTSRMSVIFHSLGVKNVKELIDKFGNLGNAIQAVESQAEKLRINSAKTWGKVQAYNAVIGLTSVRGRNSYDTNLMGMSKSEVDMAAAYQGKLQTMKAQSQLLQNELQFFAIKAGTVLLPILIKLAKFVQPVVEWFGRWIDKNPTLAKVILITAGAIGSLLLVIAPLAFMISGVASMMKLWAGYQLLLAQKAALATTATEAETVAVTGFGGALSTVETEFIAADVAAAGFFATLAAFTIPAALLTLAGMGFADSFRNDAARRAKSIVDNLKVGSPEQLAYQKWSDNWRPGQGQSWSDQDPQQFLNSWTQKQMGSRINKQLKNDHQFTPPGHMPALMNPSDTTTTQQVEILLHDPHGAVQGVKGTNGVHVTVIPNSLHQGSTTGKQ